MATSHFDIEAVKLGLPSPSQEKVAILAIHGRNQDPDFMVELLSRLGWQNFPTILPVAADKSWYPGGFMESLDKNGDKLKESLELIAKYHQELNELGYKDEQLILMGFSQGACLAAQYCLQNPRKYHGIAILTGGYIGPQGVDWSFEGDFYQTPIFISTSEIDEWVPPQRAEETAFEFKKLNGKVNFKLFKDRPHQVCEEEIEVVKQLIH